MENEQLYNVVPLTHAEVSKLVEDGVIAGVNAFLKHVSVRPSPWSRIADALFFLSAGFVIAASLKGFI